jgi:hypothetical protein
MTSSGKAKLVVQGGPNGGLAIPLSRNPLTLGRRSDNDLVVDEPSVSRRHALVMDSPAGFILRDLNTTNGTFVNREKIGHGEQHLKHGDSVRLAGSTVSFLFREEGPVTELLSAESPPTSGIVVEGNTEQGEVKEERLNVALGGKEGDLFRLLHSRKGSVVSREDLALEVWPESPRGSEAGRALDESVARIRVALGDDPADPAHLITVGEFGYLLL